MSALAFPLKKAALSALVIGLLALVLAAGCKKKPGAAPPANAAKAGTNAASTNSITGAGKTNVLSELVSHFDDDPPPENKGRDPFFPDSIRRNIVPVAPANVAPVAPGPVDPTLRLQGIAGSRGKRVATINNHVFMQTDPPESVKLPGGGAVMVKIVEIGEDYVIVQIDGVETKRLTMGQKK